MAKYVPDSDLSDPDADNTSSTQFLESIVEAPPTLKYFSPSVSPPPPVQGSHCGTSICWHSSGLSKCLFAVSFADMDYLIIDHLGSAG